MSSNTVRGGTMSSRKLRWAGVRNRSHLAVRVLTIGLFVGVCVLFAAMSPIFLMPSNLLNIVRQTALLAIMSFGMVSVIIVTHGEADMSVGGITGLSAAVAVVLLVRGAPTALSILAAIATGLAAGLLNGILVTKVGLLPFLATLATMNMAMGLEQVLTKGTYVPFADPFIGFVANENFLGVPASAFLLLLVYLAFYSLLDHMPTGRKIYAIGGNLQAARASGIDVAKYTVLTFALSGLSCGLAGVLLVGRLSGLTPLAAAPLLLDVLLAGYISSILSSVGAPSVSGALFGAMLVGVLSNGLAVIRVPTFYVNLVKGLLIIIVVAANALQRRRRSIS
ncbi:MAG: ABC transporter permease [Firmicutes bacterium]|nr:ABC transporter permease [Bacillota bacterium]